MGSVLRNVLGGKRKSRRRQKKAISGQLKRKSSYNKRIFKIVSAAPKHFWTVERMCRMLNVKDDGVLNVGASVGELVREYKLIWRQDRTDFGCFSHWIPLDEVEERILAKLGEGKVCTYLDLWSAAQLAYDWWRFQFNPGRLVNQLEAKGILTKKRNRDGGRVIYFTPDQFFEYRIRKERS